MASQLESVGFERDSFCRSSTDTPLSLSFAKHESTTVAAFASDSFDILLQKGKREKQEKKRSIGLTF